MKDRGILIVVSGFFRLRKGNPDEGAAGKISGYICTFYISDDTFAEGRGGGRKRVFLRHKRGNLKK